MKPTFFIKFNGKYIANEGYWMQGLLTIHKDEARLHTYMEVQIYKRDPRFEIILAEFN